MMPNHRRLLLPALDALLFALAWLLAYSFRHEFAIPNDDSLVAGNNYALQFKLLAVWVVATHVAFFAIFRLYQGMVRYAGTRELRAIGFATLCQLVLWGAISMFLDTREQFFDMPQRLLADGTTQVLRIPFGILTLYAILSIFLAGALRFGRRLIHEAGSRRGTEKLPRALVVGAGNVADQLLRGLVHAESQPFDPVCAVTESATGVGLRLHGVPVVGTIDKIAQIIDDNKIELVLVAMDNPSPAELQRVARACESAKVTVRIVPSLPDIARGTVDVSRVRRIEVEDLLGRSPVKIELPATENYLTGETVLITGAGGSIGSELARQAARAGAAKLLLLGKGENSVFDIAVDVRHKFPAVAVVPIIEDVRDVDRMEKVFEAHRPAIVFHAAAHKHVTLMESAPDEAIRNNVFGTANVAQLANDFAAKRFVFISTDKAVRPISVMGATKRLAEHVIFALAQQSRTLFSVVRFGNVLGSRGSAIPLFQRQIENGGPVTLTHPDVIRYFMTIPEAVSLVLQAGAQEKRGGLYLLDMGEPVRIADLARTLIVLSGYRPEIDIKIDYIGLRPGEKLREELLAQSEGAEKTGVEKLFSASERESRLWSEIERGLAMLERLCGSASREELMAALVALVPGYHPPDEDAVLRRAVQKEPSSDLAPGPNEPLDEAPLPVEEPLEAEPPVAEEPPPLSPEEPPAVVVTEEKDLFPSWEDAIVEAVEESLPEPEPLVVVEEVVEIETSSESEAKEPVAQDDLIIEEKENTEEMSTNAQSVNGPATILLRLIKGADAETVKLLTDQLKGSAGEKDQLILLVNNETKAAAPAGVDSVSYEGRAQGAAVAEAIAKSAADGILVTLSNEVLLKPGALAKFRAALAGGAPLAYSSFEEDREGKRSEVVPHDHDGCPHERFEFGPVIAYSIAAINGVGGVRKDLSFAWEYDLHLKLMEKAAFARVPEVLYTHFLQVVTDAKGSKVFSPGAGPLGGFSYVFYPADLEKEVTTVFEEALKRRGAWLSHDTVPVKHSGKHELLASIVIPILNRVRFIGNAIEKVQKGTFQDFEMIIVDNGSTDGTVDKVKQIAAADPRIRLIHGKGGSIASALNEGIKAARGKYICQLDSDDEYAPNCLEKMIGHLESHPKCGLAISYYRLMDENGVIITDVAPITHSGYSRNQVLRRDGAGAVRIFPKAVLEEFGYYDEVNYGNFGEDYDMVLKTGEKYDVDRVHDVLYHYRRHSDNTDVTRDPKMKYHNKNHSRQQALKRRIAINKKNG
ncbi:polysaccharide biosynthesis protein [Candidatus Sumerlaeota bacterium]|nr:polysaccharide biosynthesis protein [Candidatus Sumerlaeota bacterium]